MFRSLRWKFTLWYVASSVLVILIVGVAIFYAESRALTHRIEGSIRSAGDAARAATAANLERSTAVDPLDAAVQAVETVAGHGGLHANDVHVVLLDRNGFIASNPENVDAGALAQGSSIERAMADGEHWHTTEVSGSEVRVKTSPLRDPAGELIGFVQAGKSIEDNNAALRTLLLVMAGSSAIGLVLFAAGGYLVAGRAIKPVQQGYERQRQFVANASHELRTPLTVIRTNTGTLLRRHRDRDPAVEDIDIEARYMSRLLDNLLSLANGDRGLLQAHAAPFDIVTAARSAGRSAHALAQGSGLTLREELDETVMVSADAGLCRQAIFILLDNAIRYTPSGGEVVLSARSSGGEALVEVRDTGIGMTSDVLARATDRFFSGDKARSRSRGGAGLGLSIAKDLMAVLGGSLSLESEPGKGTTARLHLPLATPEAAQSSRRERQPLRPPRTTRPAPTDNAR
jgi:signal transduction histidine kinase